MTGPASISHNFPSVPADMGPYGSPAHSEWLDVDWKRHRRTADCHGARVNYVQMGEGPPLVLVHGLSGCWQNWLENIPYLARTRTVVAIDLPGFGRSDLPGEDVSIPGYGRFLEAFMTAVGIERAALAGSSMGGLIAAQTAASVGERIERLILVSAPGLGRPQRLPADVDLGRPFIARLAPYARFGAYVGALRRLALARLVTHPELIRKEIVHECAAGMGKPGVQAALRSILTYDFRPHVGKITAPTLLIWGGADRVVPPPVADRYLRAIPDARKVMLADTGHAPMLERPVFFNQLVSEFIGS
jgi:pimeloyl-ACP methyl ester carboxylesterase